MAVIVTEQVVLHDGSRIAPEDRYNPAPPLEAELRDPPTALREPAMNRKSPPRPRPGVKPPRRGERRGDPRDRDPYEAIRIVHEDPDVLIVEKPAGLLSATPPGADDASLFRWVRLRARAERRQGAWILHRLDRESSGLMVFAQSERAFHWLKEDFRARRIRRVYYALAEGARVRTGNQAEEGTAQSFLREDRLGLVRSVPEISRAGPDAPSNEDDAARLAVTFWRVLATGNDRTLFQLKMESGRKHQIRVHLADMGHPIAGDVRYGARTNPLSRLLLHAAELGFRHPATGQEVHFESLPEQAWWRLAASEPPAEAPDERSRAKTVRISGRLETAWDEVAGWYDRLIDEGTSDHHRMVIVPGSLRLLNPSPGERILDVACGQGDFCRRLRALGAEPTGIDASSELIERARARGGDPQSFQALDARDLKTASLPTFDSATCIMALMNIDPLEPVIQGVARHLKPGGAFVGVILHPSFRAPRQTSWGFDKGRRPVRQFRRVDGYLSPGQFEIVMNPGEAALGKTKVTTWTFHRPLQSYVKALSEAGFAIEALEEWPSLRRQSKGAALEENRIRKEIPLFLGFRARKLK